MKKRIQITINPELLEEAQKLMKTRKFDNLSGFVEALIRAEWEHFNTPLTLHDQPTKKDCPPGSGHCEPSSSKVAAALASTVSYHFRKVRKPRTPSPA